MLLIGMYLIAVVAANLSVAYFGPASAVLNAFLFVGLDLTSRDGLHERWHGRHLWPKMCALIAAGSLLSYLLNQEAGRVALASTVSFFVAGLVDAVVYALLARRSRFVRINGSNVLSAAVDSVLFPTIAFGRLMPWVIAGQFAAKVVGGFIWSLILRRGLGLTDAVRVEAAAASRKGG